LLQEGFEFRFPNLKDALEDLMVQNISPMLWRC